MDDNFEKYFTANRQNWDERARIHARDETGFYQIEDFLKGVDTLSPIEAAEIGDIRGQRLVHLQCHIGLDTLSLARRGAACTGLDFSAAAIATAHDLQVKSGLEAEFIEADVYDARSCLSGDFDQVFVSWGAINWLPDIQAWAQVVASLLKPGGALYLAESHPSLLCLDENNDLRPGYDWRTPRDKPVRGDDALTYTGDKTEMVNKTYYEWLHPLGDIITGLINAGLRLDFLHEHEILPWQFSPVMERLEGSYPLFKLPETHSRLPLSFSLKASKS